MTPYIILFNHNSTIETLKIPDYKGLYKYKKIQRKRKWTMKTQQNFKWINEKTEFKKWVNWKKESSSLFVE